MDEKERERCKEWIRGHVFRHSRKQNDCYVLKHIFQWMENIYCRAEEFQEVMRECGYEMAEGKGSLFFVVVDPQVLKKYYHKEVRY